MLEWSRSTSLGTHRGADWKVLLGFGIPGSRIGDPGQVMFWEGAGGWLALSSSPETGGEDCIRVVAEVVERRGRD